MDIEELGKYCVTLNGSCKGYFQTEEEAFVVALKIEGAIVEKTGEFLMRILTKMGGLQ